MYLRIENLSRGGLTSAVHLQNGARLPREKRGRKSPFWQVQPLVRWHGLAETADAGHGLACWLDIIECAR
jgi:hypothetical protein